MLQDRKVSFSYAVSKITDFSRYLIDICTDEAFNEFYDSTVELVGIPTSRSDRKHKYKDIYLQLLDCMVV